MHSTKARQGNLKMCQTIMPGWVETLGNGSKKGYTIGKRLCYWNLHKEYLFYAI